MEKSNAILPQLCAEGAWKKESSWRLLQSSTPGWRSTLFEAGGLSFGYVTLWFVCDYHIPSFPTIRPTFSDFSLDLGYMINGVTDHGLSLYSTLGCRAISPRIQPTSLSAPQRWRPKFIMKICDHLFSNSYSIRRCSIAFPIRKGWISCSWRDRFVSSRRGCSRIRHSMEWAMVLDVCWQCACSSNGANSTGAMVAGPWICKPLSLCSFPAEIMNCNAIAPPFAVQRPVHLLKTDSSHEQPPIRSLDNRVLISTAVSQMLLQYYLSRSRLLRLVAALFLCLR